MIGNIGFVVFLDFDRFSRDLEQIEKIIGAKINLMKNCYKRINFFLIILSALHFLGANLWAENLRILFTSSLNGKLEGCTCDKNPASGLAKRAYIINQYRKKYPKTIILDTGDNLSDSFDPLLLEYTLKGYKALNYTAMVFGDQELYSGMEDFAKWQRKLILPYLETGLSFKQQIPLKNHIPYKGKKINAAIIGFSSMNSFRFFPSDKKNQIQVSTLPDLEQRIKNLKKDFNYIILISHSGIDDDKKIAGLPFSPDLIISGHDQLLLKKPLYIKGTAIVSNGMNGYYIGEVLVKDKKIKKYRLIPTPYKDTPEDPVLKKLVDKFLAERKNLFQ